MEKEKGLGAGKKRRRDREERGMTDLDTDVEGKETLGEQHDGLRGVEAGADGWGEIDGFDDEVGSASACLLAAAELGGEEDEGSVHD